MTGLPALRFILFTALLAATAACTGATRADLKPGEVPPADTVEAGLWLVMEKVEARVRTSGSVIPDPALQDYVHDIACGLAGAHCAGLRTYVVNHPSFNATMAPNGFMTVWSGLLLRCENEDQLATVIGHEIGHYLRRHQVQHWETIRNSFTAAQLFGIATAMVGVPLGDLAALGAYGHVMAYGRDLEREADDIGFSLMNANGYDPHQAPRLWENLIAEHKAAENDEPDPFFASHPPSEERMESLSALAATSEVTGAADSARFHRLMAPHRADWLEDEIDLGRFAEMQVVLERLKESGQNPGVVWYYLGEVLRRNVEAEDKSEAVATFRKALEFDDAPAVTYRSLGLLLAYQGDQEGAYSAYESYLAAAPDADDAAMIQFYMEKLETRS